MTKQLFLRLSGLGSFLLSAAWALRWEPLRAYLYEQGFKAIDSLGGNEIIHWGVPSILALVGIFLFWKSGNSALQSSVKATPLHAPERVDWPLRDLFGYLAPHLPLRATKKTGSGAFIDGTDSRWKPIGDIVLKQLSLGRLHAVGRQRVQNTKRLHSASIPPEFWRDAKFSFWFLDTGPSTVMDASNGHDAYSEIEVNRAEALAIWPNGAEISLLEAAREVYEGVKDAPISIVIESFSDGPDDILTWVCNEIAMYRDGKEPLVKLRGNKPPARNSEEIYTAMLTSYDFVVEGNAIVLQARHGKSRYENLTVIVAEVDRAIRELASRQV